MLTDHEPTPYDGPYNSWLLQYAQDQIVAHQRQLAYHERELRFWEQTSQTLLASQANASPSFPTTEFVRQDSKPARSRALPAFRNPFTEDGEGEKAATEKENTEEAGREREGEGEQKENGAQANVWENEPVESPFVENENNHSDSHDNNAVASVEPSAEAAEEEARAREEARAQGEARAQEEARAREREEAARAEAQAAEEEEQRRREAADVEREAELQRERDRAEAVKEQPVAPEPEPSPSPQPAPSAPPAAASPTPPPRKVPANSPGLHADAASVASNTALKERMARLGGLNPLAMMPGQGVPLMRPKSRVVEEEQSQLKAALEPEKRSADTRSTQEFKPIPPEKSSAASPPTSPETSRQPEPGRPQVRGPAPPPRKPGPSPSNNSINSSSTSSSSPPLRGVGEPAKGEPHKPEPKEASKPAARTSGDKKYCKANFDLDNPPKGCPKFKKGDIAECIEVKGEWSHVIFLKNGEEGHVPTAYFTMDVAYTPASPAVVATAAPATAGPVRKMKALFPFAPPKPKGFVPLKVGEIVTWEKGEPGEEWWVVKNAAGLSGYVPHNYVKLL